jgi:sugar phosphate isomerase/epimerase
MPNVMQRLCVHTVTTKPLSLEACLELYPQHGISGITVWRQTLEGQPLPDAARKIRNSGLHVVSLCRGGFFPASTTAARQAAIDDNRLAIDQAHAIGAPLVVLVCGAVPGQSLEQSRQQIADGLHAVLPHAQQAGVRLAIEPLHPMYADNRSAINTLRQANDLCDQLGSHPSLGIAVDLYHVWWDPELPEQIRLTAQKNRLDAFHLCDWLTPTADLLNDRGLMGEGCIPIQQISRWVDQTGFSGFREVEIFSNRWWAADQRTFLTEITRSYQSLFSE